MARRIAISILFTVWVVLLLAGTLAYFVTRKVLIENLDATLVGRIVSLPEIERPASFRQSAATDARDRFIIQNQQGQTVARPPVAKAADVPPPAILSRSFTTLADGSRLRTLKVQAFARRADHSAPLLPVTVVYSGPADQLDALLSELAFSLGLYGLLAGMATASIAVLVARTALKPLFATTQTLQEISERTLDRRIAVEKLPVELAPVGRRLNELLERLERAFAQRKQFLADASHELRTPVAAIITTLEVTLHKERSGDEYRRALESCLADARLLHQLVAALLDHVREEHFSGAKAAAELAPVRVSAVISHCVDIAQTLAATKNIQVERRIPDGLAGITDELKLRSIAMNLLSNAVEYTPAGGKITVLLQEHPAAADDRPLTGPSETAHGEKKKLRLIVADTGMGIAAEHLPHLFEPFYRADKARSHADQHLGLGLFLVQEHLHGLGGNCKVESPYVAEGSEGIHVHGSKFSITIPMVMLLVNANEPPIPATNAAGALIKA